MTNKRLQQELEIRLKDLDEITKELPQIFPEKIEDQK